MASARGSPLRAGGLARADAWSVAFFALLVVAFALYLVALLLLRARRERVAVVFAVAAVVQFVPLFGPLVLSRDTYSYWAYGRIAALHNGNPFSVAPADFPHDPATRAVAPAWRDRTSVYGPAFTEASAVVSHAAGRSAERASLLFRLAAAMAAVAATALAAIVARRKAFASAFVGWNPLVAVSFAGGGHNDAWMLVLILGALALVARRRDAAGGALWILAIAIKAVALPLLLLELLRARRAFLLGTLAAGMALAIAATAVFGTAWLTSLGQLGHEQARFSLPARLEQLGISARAAHGLSDLVLVAGAVWLAREALRGRTRLALGASLLILTSPWVLPWYATWPVALASLEEDAAGQLVALGLVAYFLPARIPL